MRRSLSFSQSSYMLTCWDMGVFHHNLVLVRVAQILMFVHFFGLLSRQLQELTFRLLSNVIHPLNRCHCNEIIGVSHFTCQQPNFLAVWFITSHLAPCFSLILIPVCSCCLLLNFLLAKIRWQLNSSLISVHDKGMYLESDGDQPSLTVQRIDSLCFKSSINYSLRCCFTTAKSIFYDHGTVKITKNLG